MQKQKQIKNIRKTKAASKQMTQTKKNHFAYIESNLKKVINDQTIRQKIKF